ncbi:MAG: hypothetical protein KDE46_23580 [Caldilineaceae bacterium]|nr:hypothetical protein [Caldilineaceae bacterium]
MTISVGGRNLHFDSTAIRHAANRLRFTLVMLLLLSIIAVWSETHSARLVPALLARFGFSVADFWSWRWERLITSALITHGARAFWGALLMIGVAVGRAEWQTGTRRTFLLFWGAHLLTLLLLALVAAPLNQLNIGGIALDATVRDVGPSAGYMACLGLAIATFPHPWHRIVALCVLAALVAMLFIPPQADLDPTVKLFADLAHLIAFPLGWGSYFRTRLYPNRAHL